MTEGTSEIVRAIRDDRELRLTPVEQLVLIYIASRLPNAYPSQQTLADEVGVDARTIRRAIRRLIQVGVLSARRMVSGGGNVYQIDLDGGATTGHPCPHPRTPVSSPEDTHVLTTGHPCPPKTPIKTPIKTKAKILSSFHDDIEPAFDAWNTMAERAGLPRVQLRSEARKKSLSARLKDAGGLEGWLAALEKVEASPFLRGERGAWKANFEFVSKAANFAKIMEGNYDDDKRGPNAGREPTDGVAVGSAMRAFMEVMGGPQDRDPEPDWPGRPGGGGSDAGNDRPGGGSGGTATGGRGSLPAGKPRADSDGADKARAYYGALGQMGQVQALGLRRSAG